MLNEIGLKIRKYREEAGMSQKKLGMILGLSDKAISAYESCRTLPPIETLFRISQELSKPLKYFLSDDNNLNNVEERVDQIESNVTSLLNEVTALKKLLEENPDLLKREL